MTDSSTHYTVLARRFRPQTFDDVVGQNRIGQAIRNAIQSGRVAHAYLFTGARGVGKTSTARIFAKALNCPNVADAVPCNECEVCESIAAGSDVDVLEIDGASNRGIDDIRTLRANVNVRSMRSPYKVYIIDEVHMLTKEAFNALLKTLEEPPPNVKFVFCTTEPNKVPDTILSRCQRFDFGTIDAGSIAGRLGQIAEAEGVEVDQDALDLLARRAAGSMRDSQSLFDQLLAFGSDHITVADVHQLLGTAGDDRLIGLFDAIINRRRDESLALLDTAMNEGVQVGAFSDQVLHYLRDLLVLAAGAEVTLETVAESQRATLLEQADRWGLQTISAGLEIMAHTKARSQRVNYDRTLLELAIIRLSLLEDLDNIGALIGAVRSGGTPGASSPPSAPPSKSPPANPASSPPSGSAPKSQASVRPVTSESTDSEANEVTAAVEKSEPAENNVAMPDGEQAGPDSSSTSLSAESRVAADEPSHAENATTIRADPAPAEANPVDNEPTSSPQVSKTIDEARTQELTESSLDIFWTQVLDSLPDRMRTHLSRVDGLAISGPNCLELSFPASYVLSREWCERPETLARINEQASQVSGRSVEVTITSSAEQPTAAGKPVKPTAVEPVRRKTSDVNDDPFVQQALDIFGGTVIDVREVHEPAGSES